MTALDLADLDAKAAQAGILLHRPAPGRGDAEISDVAKRRLLQALGLPDDVPPAADDVSSGPSSCYLPDFLHGGKAWGIALQLYELRSHRNWGIGDFADLAEFCAAAGRAGADFVGLNPLHALFLAEPSRCSPFSPSNRLFLNPLYIAVDLVDPAAAELVDGDTLERLRQTDLVDYDEVAGLKLAALRTLWRRHQRDVPRAFIEEGGEALHRHALFEALSLAMKARGFGAGWQAWPEPLRDHRSEEVSAFAADNGDEVDFHVWLQWLADDQLIRARTAAGQAGMRIGLYLDLAVGEAPDGSATWSEPADFVPGVTVGAPPDMFSTQGQDWGLAALSPHRLRSTGAARFGRMARRAMGRCGALRLDHAMALSRLFLTPEGLTPEDGAYVLYPFELLVGELARASRDCETMMIGEDLGTVPEGFRDAMRKAAVLSYRILYFEQHESGFVDAEAWPELAFACLSTHDLPTFLGWWNGDDVRLRAEHGLIDAELAAEQQARRATERGWLRDLFRLGNDDDSPHDLAVAAHRFIGGTPSLLAAARLADLAGEREPTNLPGTADSYPNWRRKLAVPVERIEAAPLWQDVTGMLAALRPRLR